jgi:kynurenine formamidase
VAHPTIDRDLLAALLSASVIDLSQPLDARTPCRPGTIPFRSLLFERHGDHVGVDGTSAAVDFLTLTGHTGTHIDALGHISDSGTVFGGRSAAEEVAGGALQTLGVDRIASFFYRGVLVDAALHRGVYALDGKDVITAEDLGRALAQHGVEVQQGTAVLVRTGWGREEIFRSARYSGAAEGMPGIDTTAASLLADAGAAIVGSDTLAVEHIAAGVSGVVPVHRLLLANRGIPLVENLNLEKLAAAEIYEFTLIVIPLPIIGGTGSPIRPLALVRPAP